MNNGVVKIAEFSDANTWTKTLPNAAAAKVMAATVNGYAALNTGIVGVGTTLPYKYKLANVSSEDGKFLVCGWDKLGNFISEVVTANSATAASFSNSFYMFPTRGFAYLIDNGVAAGELDAADDFLLCDTTSGTALILGDVNMVDTNLATSLPAIAVPPGGYAIIKYLAIAAGDVSAGTCDYRLKIYDLGTAETMIEKFQDDGDKATYTWYNEGATQPTTLRIDGGYAGKVAYLEATTTADDSAVSSSYSLTYDLYAKFTQGGIAGLIADAKRSTSTQQS